MFKSLGGLGNLTSLLGNLQHIGPRMKAVAEDMRNRQFNGSAGDGAVMIVINGIGQTIDMQISDSARSSDQLTAWIMEACNQAGAEAKRQYAAAIQQVADDLDIKLPGMDSMLSTLTGGA